ncbi:hypothetical protein [Aquisphaera insulae]|uniref:hypothetical protein n=1 Tax=Aquisphaera insulae TaxID=2712864 RepID=UPI0013EDACA5|nr:hypothetical protein [Aquisphaera insulae]
MNDTATREDAMGLWSGRARALAVAAALALVLAATAGLMPGGARAADGTYYVDGDRGDDGRDGMAPGRAWRSIDRVNAAAEIRPGDRVLFRRGSTFRGSLRPHGGAKDRPVVYGAYGDAGAPKPRLLGSADRSRPDDWVEVRAGIWATRPVAYRPRPGAVARDLTGDSWSLYVEGGARARCEVVDGLGPGGDRRGLRVSGEAPGTAAHHVQLSTAGLDVRRGGDYRLVFRARATTAVVPTAIALMRASPPWTGYATVRPGTRDRDRDRLKIAPEWSEQAVLFHADGSDPAARLTVFLGGALPAGTVLELAGLRLEPVECNQAQPLSVDVGNVVFDGGRRTGVKKWGRNELKAADDYYYDPAGLRVFLRSDGPPTDRARSIELALNRPIVDETGVRFVRYQDLDLRQGAGHGIGGSDVEGITVAGCDFSYIGGGHQFTDADGRPVRFGNAVEFWANARDCLVERCRIGEVYDAALTNQGSGVNVQKNIVYRFNTIWNSEYSFELWDRDEASRMEDIRFEFNTCVDAGYGWAHGQRPDPNGRHLMLYDSSARASGVVIRGNVFSRARDSLLRLHGRDWTKALAMDANVWHQPADVGGGAVLLWQDRALGRVEAESFLRGRGFDRHSVFDDPRFVDRARGDLRLAPESPARGLVDGRDAGAGG